MYLNVFNVQLFNIDKKADEEIFCKSTTGIMPEIFNLKKLTRHPSNRKWLADFTEYDQEMLDNIPNEVIVQRFYAKNHHGLMA